ncbi:hypothetical protein Taro_053922 [Colocasia esculenta]|uniref:Uncharacterized protein n=1 Tax=Colocasia esculenta TaxID=4460 RepID=A0A843XNZ3_COLES|nr:hypothetical protein [Colocasia esculenta]
MSSERARRLAPLAGSYAFGGEHLRGEMSPCLRWSSRLIATRRHPPEKSLQTRSEVALAGVAAELVAGKVDSAGTALVFWAEELVTRGCTVRPLHQMIEQQREK